MRAVERGRDRVTEAVRGLFAAADRPLERTAEFAGDPGLCGPDSVSWRVIGDTSVFVGAIRGLLIQAAHPEVAAGVEDHSRYRDDPMGRLGRTAYYVTTATFGAMPEVHDTLAMVAAAHRGVSGTSHRGLPYAATTPEMAAWVHNTLTDSFLCAYQEFGPGLNDADADRFVAEQTRVGALMGAAPLPDTAAGLARWVRFHPAVGASPGMTNALGFLLRPPFPVAQRLGYLVLLQGAVATVPAELREVLGLRPRRGAKVSAAAMVRTLRAIMGNSPAWKASLERCGASYDAKLFR